MPPCRYPIGRTWYKRHGQHDAPCRPLPCMTHRHRRTPMVLSWYGIAKYRRVLGGPAPAHSPDPLLCAVGLQHLLVPAISTLPIIAPPTPLETVSIQPDRWLSTEKWFMDDIESLSLDEKETSTGESKVAGEEGEFRFYLWSSFRGRCYRAHQGRRSQSQR